MQVPSPGVIEAPIAALESNVHGLSSVSGVVSRFNRFLSMLAALPASDDLFTAAAQELVDLLDARFVAITTYQPAENVLVCRAFTCTRALDPSMPMMLGTNHIGYVTPPVPEEIHTNLLNGRLYPVPGGVFNLLIGGVPVEACLQAEQAMGIAECYAAGMTWQGALVGSITMGMQAGAVVDAALVEACARQIAVLHRQRETERLLTEANILLEDRVSQRTAQLERSNRALIAEIAERRQVERYLRASQANLQAIFENVEDSIWSVDADYRLVFGNSVFRRNLAAAFGRLILPGESVLDLGISADAYAEWKGYYDRALAGERFTVERSGRYLPTDMTEYRFGPICAEDGYVVAAIAFSHDVSEQWRVKEALRMSEEKYRRLFDNAQVGMFRTRLDGSEVLEINDRMASMVQRPKADVVGKPTLLNWADPAKRAALLQAITDFGHVTAFEMPALVSDGAVHTLLLSVTAYPDENLLEGTAVDITERKQIEDALSESERRLSNLMHNLPGMAYRCHNDECWTMEFLSEGVEALTGYRAGDLVNNRKASFADVIDPLDRGMVWATVQSSIAANHAFRMSYRIHTVTGEQKWVWEQGTAVRSEDGAVVALEGFITDITELKVAQEAIRDSELRFRSLFVSSSIGTAIVSPDGIIMQANPALGDLLDCAPSQLVGKSIAEITYPEDCDESLAQIRMLLTGSIASFTLEQRYVTLAGLVVWAQTTVSPVQDMHGEPQFLIAQIQDIGERRAVQAKLEELYRRAQHDAQEKSVLLNEVDHRVKNNLMAILGLLLAEQQFAQAEQRSVLEAYVENIARRIKGLLEVHRMLSESQWASLQLSELGARLIHAELDALSMNGRVSVSVTPSHICVSPRQASNLAIVFNELLANSLKHALNDAAQLQVSMKLSADENEINVEYRDNGSGYPLSVSQQQQHGVGLYLIRRIVEHTLHGRLTIFNDGGAVTQISIPIEAIEHTIN